MIHIPFTLLYTNVFNIYRNRFFKISIYLYLLVTTYKLYNINIQHKKYYIMLPQIKISILLYL